MKKQMPHREDTQIRTAQCSRSLIRVLCVCSAKFIYGPRFVGIFEPSAGRYRGRASICGRYVYACMRRTTIPVAEDALFPRTGYSQSFRTVIDHDRRIHLHNLALTRLCATESCMYVAPLIRLQLKMRERRERQGE